MTNTERTHRRRERLRDERAEQERITGVYFAGREPLSPDERRRLLKECLWLVEE
jgi:hypothetical protein